MSSKEGCEILIDMTIPDTEQRLAEQIRIPLQRLKSFEMSMEGYTNFSGRNYETSRFGTPP